MGLLYLYLSMFRALAAHHQELNDCSGSLWFLPSYRGNSRAVFVVGLTDPTTNTAYYHDTKVKTKGCHCSH
jgi:hypothetical protein